MYKHPDDKTPDLNPSSVPVSAGVILKLMGGLFFVAFFFFLAIGVIIK